MHRNRRLLLTFIILSFVFCFLVYRVVYSPKPRSTEFINPFYQYDPATFFDIRSPGLLSEASLKRLYRFVNFVLKDLDIEFVTVVVPDLGGRSINEAASLIMKERKIGARTKGARGLLLLIVVDEKLVRFEVGYDLESVFPDAFVGYIGTEQMRPFFEEGKVGAGIEATIEMIVSRAYEQIKESGYDPAQKQNIPEEQFSGGGGTKKEASIGIRQGPLKRKVGEETHLYFSAGRTPEETFEKYLESCRRGITDPSLDIFSDQDKKFFANWTVTQAQLMNFLRDYEGKAYKMEIKNDRAVLLYSPSNRKLAPIFLKQERGGWVLDYYTQSEVTRFSQKNYWFLTSTNHPYMWALEKYFYFDQYSYPHLKEGVEDWTT